MTPQPTEYPLTSSIIRVVLADDHPLVLQGLCTLLDDEPDIEVVAIATNGPQLLDALRRYAPDVVVIDLQLPQMDGLTCLRRIREEGIPVRVLILSAFGDRDTIRTAMEHQADGFVLKTEPPQQAITAIRQVYSGHLVFPRVPQSRAAAQPTHPARSLSPREWQVLELVARGFSNKQIAHTLQVSERTVKFHLQNIYAKLGVMNRTEAARFFYRHRPAFLVADDDHTDT